MSKPIPYQPLGNHLLLAIKPPKEESAGGIYIPVQSRDKPLEGKIVDMGSTVMEPSLKIGDTVVYTKHSEYTLKVDDQLLILVAEPNVILRIPAGTEASDAA